MVFPRSAFAWNEKPESRRAEDHKDMEEARRLVLQAPLVTHSVLSSQWPKSLFEARMEEAQVKRKSKAP